MLHLAKYWPLVFVLLTLVLFATGCENRVVVALRSDAAVDAGRDAARAPDAARIDAGTDAAHAPDAAGRDR